MTPANDFRRELRTILYGQFAFAKDNSPKMLETIEITESEIIQLIADEMPKKIKTISSTNLADGYNEAIKDFKLKLGIED